MSLLRCGCLQHELAVGELSSGLKLCEGRAELECALLLLRAEAFNSISIEIREIPAAQVGRLCCMHSGLGVRHSGLCACGSMASSSSSNSNSHVPLGQVPFVTLLSRLALAASALPTQVISLGHASVHSHPHWLTLLRYRASAGRSMRLTLATWREWPSRMHRGRWR